jgi:hypothetical protein
VCRCHHSSDDDIVVVVVVVVVVILTPHVSCSHRAAQMHQSIAVEVVVVVVG